MDVRDESVAVQASKNKLNRKGPIQRKVQPNANKEHTAKYDKRKTKGRGEHIHTSNTKKQEYKR